MGIYQQLLVPHRFWTRVALLSVSIVLLGLLITISLAQYETKHRLHMVEYQHRLFVDELSRVSDSGKKSHLAEDAILRLQVRKQQLMHSSSMGAVDKLITELKEIKRKISPDKTVGHSGRPDFALQTAGAQILSVGKTKVLTPFPQWLSSIYGFHSISKYFVNGAHRVIQPSIHPGECFAFTGPGEIIIKLIRNVFIDAVGIEHILPQMSPDGFILNAPSVFSVYGMENEDEPNDTHLGTYRYDIEKYQSLQGFQLPANSTDKSFPIVKFEFAPNENRALNYTCIYRVLVYGSLIKPN
ncbi:SUN domain-containing protein 3 [Sitodiplosis mosellana]|uniref:SUN domain-containing protein 3 n=1 Tax=Sitodiplosis mosellana TaxID=263140 RepID=UPI002444E178|nr:SUN domain-containing protein 3 [Sitodiplosis mosellana]